MDLRRAFPKLKLKLLAEAMRHFQIPLEIAAPLLAEMINQITNLIWNGEGIRGNTIPAGDD